MGRQMLLSINPEHVASILCGIKRYEYRKVRCRDDVDKVVIYATAPKKAVVAEADLETIIEGTVVDVWERTKGFAGISYAFFRAYYEGKNKAIAYKLGNIRVYAKPKALSSFGLTYPPQSFLYLKTTP